MNSQAVVIHGAHDLRLETRETAGPGPGQVGIAVQAGGICGTDLHYYQHGGFGAIRVREPMILGHEVAGVVTAAGDGVTNVQVGQTVAINPSLACGQCQYCQAGIANHCDDMRFYGSAMRMPHVQGAFRGSIVAEARQCVPLPDGTPVELAALCEPFAVTLHAVRHAREAYGARGLDGMKVLVTGCGPIGLLAIIAARNAGATEVVATDVAPAALAMARRIGADATLDPSADANRIEKYGAGKGAFDVLIEASGNSAALTAGVQTLRPRGVAVLVGLGGDIAMPAGAMIAREIRMLGSFRFFEEFEEAARLIGSGAVDVAPLITHQFPVADAVAAFNTALDRSQAMKVQLRFD
ncbi:MAG TPA: L-idonate 5-dehydrogenase [Hyphomicrobiaceae bacterium]|nr:L-idonate 5-dehydrogenase [Hyphomicrobiaceae bacterium]